MEAIGLAAIVHKGVCAQCSTLAVPVTAARRIRNLKLQQPHGCPKSHSLRNLTAIHKTVAAHPDNNDMITTAGFTAVMQAPY